jgi:hypothetical protein
VKATTTVCAAVAFGEVNKVYRSKLTHAIPDEELRDPEKCGQLKKEAVRYDTPVDNFTLSTHGAPLPQKASGGYWFWRIIWGMFAHAKNISLPNLDIYLASRNHGVSSKIWLI